MPADVLRRAADTALEATILASFTRIGPAVRRPLFGWADPGPDALSGQVVVVTGATSGLGKVTHRESVAPAPWWSWLLADRLDRAVWMSSGGMYLQDVELDDLGWEDREWNGSRAYAQAKRAQIDLVVEATEQGEAPFQVAMHPGWVDTPGVDAALPGFRKIMGPLLRQPADGADTAVWLTAAPEGSLEAAASTSAAA
jgi:NAD(P)-dependent dehydrogenase (short-subunit alcohol dehydrogenase family)